MCACPFAGVFEVRTGRAEVFVWFAGGEETVTESLISCAQCGSARGACDTPEEAAGCPEAGRDAMERYLVRSVLALANEHREHCPGEACTVSLMVLAKLLSRAGIELTKEELRRLW